MYRRLIREFFKIVWPLNDYQRKGKELDRSDLKSETPDGFNTLKSKLIEPPRLVLPQPNRQYTININPFANVLVAVLSQHQKDRIPNE